MNASSFKVGLLLERDLNHDSYFLSYHMQAMQIKSPCFKPFWGSSKLQRTQLKMAEIL
jgi:hypothetical protein